jgi:hypothetical protein
MFEILYHFISEDGILRYIKWLDKRSENLYEWEWLPFGYNTVKMLVKSSGDSMIFFDQGSLKYDRTSGIFKYYDKTFDMFRSK